VQAVQAVHAAIAIARTGLIPAELVHPNLVLLQVPDEQAVISTADQLVLRGIAHSVYREPDIGGEITALATKPLCRKNVVSSSNIVFWRPRCNICGVSSTG
jgi:hypothetical protein